MTEKNDGAKALDFQLSKSSLLGAETHDSSSLFDDAYKGVSNYVKENPFKTGAFIALAATSGIGLLVLTRKRLPEAVDSMSAGGVKDILTSSMRAGADSLSSATQQRISMAREGYAGNLVRLWTLPKQVPVKAGENMLAFTQRVFSERALITGETVAAQPISSEAHRIARLNGVHTWSDLSGKTLNVLSPDHFSRLAKFMQRKQLASLEDPDLFKPALSSVRLKFMENVAKY